MSAPEQTPAEDEPRGGKDYVRAVARNRREMRQLGRHATAGRGRARRAAAQRHPLALPVVDGRTQRVGR